ncbi:hypothetical protein [Nocardia thailandica]
MTTNKHRTKPVAAQANPIATAAAEGHERPKPEPVQLELFTRHSLTRKKPKR